MQRGWITEFRRFLPIHLLKDKKFDPEVDNKFGNYDYLMGTDLDLENEQVREEFRSWGSWFLKETGVDGFRFDAVKHVRYSFLIDTPCLNT